jgi:hypothetical protein
VSDDTHLKPDPAAPLGPSPSATKPRRFRRIVTWVLVILFGILTPITMISAWAIRTVTNTDRYVATLAPLVEKKALTDWVASQATTKLFDQLDVQGRITSILPAKAAVIAGPVTAQLHSFADTEMRKAASSKVFKDFWNKENAYTHSTAINILTGKSSPKISRAREVAISITPVITQGIDNLDKRGVTVFNSVKDTLQTNRALSLQLFSSQQIKQAQQIFGIAINFRMVLLIGTPLIGLFAILVSVDRRRSALRVMLAGLLGCLALSAGLTVAREAFVSHSGSMPLTVAQSLFDTLVHFLHRSILIMLAIFAITAMILWLTGSSTWAVALRRSMRRRGAKLGEVTAEARQSEAVGQALVLLGRGADVVATKQPPFRWIGVGVAAIFLLTVSSTAGILWTLVLLGLYQLTLVGVARWSRSNHGTDQESAISEKSASGAS